MINKEIEESTYTLEEVDAMSSKELEESTYTFKVGDIIDTHLHNLLAYITITKCNLDELDLDLDSHINVFKAINRTKGGTLGEYRSLFVLKSTETNKAQIVAILRDKLINEGDTLVEVLPKEELK